MTANEILNRKRFAHRIGFQYINVLQAVQSMGYSEEEAKEICTNAGIDWEKDIEQTKNEYKVTLEQSRKKRQKRYAKYQGESKTELTEQQLHLLDILRTYKSILCKECEIETADSLVRLGLARKLSDGSYDRGEKGWDQHRLELEKTQKLSLKELIEYTAKIDSGE